MSKNRYIHRILAAGMLTTALVVSACTPEKPAAEEKTNPDASYNFAQVNYEELVTLHPSYQELQALDEKIAQKEVLKREITADAFKELQKEGQGRMKTAVEQAKAKLEGERAAIEGEMAALSASLSAQMEGEMKSIQARLQDELDTDIKELTAGAKPKPDEAPEPDPLLNAGRNEGQVQDYIANLALVRERNLAARRLELEKRAGDAVNAKKAEIDGQMAAYEADLAAQYQSERVNLQLTAQNSVDEAAKSAAEARLNAISGEIDAKKAAKRAELDAGYAAVRSEETARLQADLEAYQSELNAEVNAKVAQKRRELGDAPEPVARPQTPSGPPPEIQAKIEEMRARMNAELSARQSELKGQMAGKAAEAKARLEAKQEQVQKELKEIEIEIAKTLAERAKELSPQTKAKVDKATKEVEELQKQRQALADQIAADISREVGEVAKKKGADMVVGVVPNLEYSSYPDITELAKVAVQTEDSK